MTQTLPDRWLEMAASQGSTRWVKQFIQAYLPPLQQESITPDDFAQRFTSELENRDLSTPAQQKNYRSNLTQALKVIDPQHPAITLVALSTETYRELNDQARGRLADRETKYFTSATAEWLVARATTMLDSAEWSAVAAGLAVLIGRRISEILLSRFALHSEWSLDFSEMAKKGEATGMTIEIPTLAPADRVLRAIERLQTTLRIADLRLETVTPKGAKQRVNSRYSETVAKQCDAHFADLIPTRTDREDLYTHVFRAVYATIAAHWFCPPTVPEHQFKAEIQGHFTLSTTGQKLPNYSARANYDDYAIGTEDGNRDGRLGIKLGTLPGLQVIEAFRKDPIEEATQMEPEEQLMASESQAAIEPDGDRDQAQTVAAEAEIKAEVEAEVLETPAVEVRPAIAPDPPVTLPTPRPPFKQPKVQATDLAKLTDLMARRGVLGSPAQLLHALLVAFEQEHTQHQQQQVQTIGEVAQTLNWFTQEIEALRGQVASLQHERDRLQAQRVETSEIQRLQTENALLKTELQRTRDRMAGIQQLLGKGAGPDIQPEREAYTASTPAARAVEAGPVDATERSRPDTAAMQPTATTQSHREPSRPRTRGGTDDKISHIIDAMIAYNTSQEDRDRMLRISIPAIKGLAKAMGANYQPAIQATLEARSEELDELHGRLMLGQRHNATIRRKDDILKTIARENLGLENWQQVKFA